jgi:large subunit ribosomal protein L18
MEKKNARLKRAAKARVVIRNSGINRLSIHKTPRHIYAQVLSVDGAKVLACASTVQKGIRAGVTGTGNIDAARTVGRLVAERSLAAGISLVAFDRAGFKYHGRVKALADAARETGLKF